MSEVKVDTISERTVANGVAVDGVTIKDSGLTIPSGGTLTIDSGGTITNNGSSSGFDSGLASVQIFTSSGTWTKPSGVTKVMVEVQGGGSGGNAASSQDSVSSGAGGGYARKLIDVSSISSSTITIGSGGAGVSSGTATGNAGGQSSWADGTNTITCNGGANPIPATAQVVLGGTATGGDINIKGQNGSTLGGYQFNRDTGIGGSSVLGIGGRYSADSASSDPDATGYGAGGSVGNTTVDPSGSGGSGIVIVTEYK